MSFDFKRAYKAAWFILSANMPLKELNLEDFREWFDSLATRKPNAPADGGADAKYIDLKPKDDGNVPSPFTRLLMLCARKSVHLSVPIQTFVPVSL